MDIYGTGQFSYLQYHYQGTNFPIKDSHQAEVDKCETCKYYIGNLEESFANSMIDPLNQIFYIKVNPIYCMSIMRSYEQIYLKARLVRVLECKINSRYQILNLLVINEISQLAVISFQVSDSTDASLDILSKMLLPFQVYTFLVNVISYQDNFQFKQYSNSTILRGIPIFIHMHKDEDEINIDIKKWVDFKLSNMNEIVSDAGNQVIHKTYDLVGILKHFTVEQLNNFQFAEQSGLAILVLVDINYRTFKAKIWGDFQKLCKLQLKDLILLTNFKIDYDYQMQIARENPSPISSNNSIIQMNSIGYSRYEQNPQYLNPQILESAEIVKSAVFLQCINELTNSNTFINEVVISDTLIETVFLNETPLRITFRDINNQLITTQVEDENLASKIRSEDLNDYSKVYFNIIISPRVSFDQTGQPNTTILLKYIN